MSQPYCKEIRPINEASTPANSVEGKLIDRLRGKSGLELLKEVLGALRAQSWLFQSLHWQAKGSNFYQLHLLYERIYGGLGDEIDTMAEKMVGYFGAESVERMDSMDRAEKWLKEWRGNEIATAIKSEKDFQALLRYTYDTMSQRKELSLGLDDFLMATASSHETNLYLLGQQAA